MLNLKRMLQLFLDHRNDVLTRRTKFELEKAQARAQRAEALDRLSVNRVVAAERRLGQPVDAVVVLEAVEVDRQRGEHRLRTPRPCARRPRPGVPPPGASNVSASRCGTRRNASISTPVICRRRGRSRDRSRW